MTQHTFRPCKGYLTKKERDVVLHQMTWPPQSPGLNPMETVWVEVDRSVKEKQPTSAQHMWELLQDCWKRQKVATLKNLKSQIYLDLVNTFWLVHDSICVIS